LELSGRFLVSFLETLLSFFRSFSFSLPVAEREMSRPLSSSAISEEEDVSTIYLLLFDEELKLGGDVPIHFVRIGRFRDGCTAARWDDGMMVLIILFFVAREMVEVELSLARSQLVSCPVCDWR